MLHSAFASTDNPYLANTFYEYEDGGKFSALERINYIWSLMFSGFTLDRYLPEPVVPIPESAIIESDLDFRYAGKRDIIHFASHWSYGGDPIETLDLLGLFLVSRTDVSENLSTTLTMDTPAVAPNQNWYERRMEFSRDQFLHSLPNPTNVYKSSKSHPLI